MNCLLFEEGINEHIKLCRVCLVMDVRMYDLQTYPLETYFENIIGIPVIGTMEIPPYICYECASLVKKFSFFKERCLKGQAMLYGILQSSGKISEQEIKQIDRNKLHLTSHLQIHNTTIEGNLYYEENSSDVQWAIDETPITNSVNNSIEVTIDLGCIKEENDFTQADFDFAPTSDDEPLVVHKTIKGKKKQKKKGKKKKVVELEEDVDEGFQFKGERTSQHSPEIADSSTKDEPKRKRGRPKKSVDEKPAPKPRRTTNTGGVLTDDVDLEEYVTILTLSVEEQLEEISKRKESLNYLNAPFQCNLCFKGFIDTNAWKHHVGKHDPNAGDVECPICKFRFPTKRALQKHQTNHEKKYACKSCSYVSKTTTQAKQHQRWHKGVTYTCEYCDEVSTKWTSYLSHVRIKHPSQYICGVCGYSFVSQLGLTMHKTMMHKDVVTDRDHICQECINLILKELINRNKGNIGKPRKGHQMVCVCCGISISGRTGRHSRRLPVDYPERTYIAAIINPRQIPANARVCNACWQRAHYHYNIQEPEEPPRGVRDQGEISESGSSSVAEPESAPTQIKQEKPGENGEEPGPYCEECDVKFRSAEAYNRHLVTCSRHSQTNNFSKGCRVCGATFKSPEELKAHHRKEHARRRPKNYGKKPSNTMWPAKCQHCGEVIDNARDHWTHFRRAHPDKTYPIQKNHVCDICGKSFRGNAFLVYHKRTHTEDRAYKCEICGKAFFNQTNLNMHSRTHSDQRPYPCNVCLKAFKCKGALDRHYRSHTGVKPYECEVCGKAFGQSNSRKLHVRTVHLKQPGPYAGRARADRRKAPPLKQEAAPHPFVY